VYRHAARRLRASSPARRASDLRRRLDDDVEPDAPPERDDARGTKPERDAEDELRRDRELRDGARDVRIHERVDDPSRYAERDRLDRKSTRLNSSHVKISYAVFC